MPTREPLAIVGMSCRFPGGNDEIASFWSFLLDSGNGVSVVPADRWSADRFHCPDVSAAGKLVTRWGGFTQGIAEFDAEFFGISPREASRMDPQQRRLLELAWEAMEDACCPPSSMRGTATGVYIGVSTSDYGKIQHDFIERIDGYTNSGNALSILANRVSYLYDLKGPSFIVDTACSSGLVAVNLACASLWSGECESALAGATNLLIPVDNSLGLSKAGMLSPTGSCKAFDARGDGYVRGEGAGMVLLKPLHRALADGNRIHALILAGTVNQDGKTSSLTVPGVASQSAMLEASLAAAGIPPTRVTYVEAHGTGTPVGDPVETRALGQVLSRGRPAGRDCLIGSVKTNLGHLEAASGLAGLIKAALIVRERMIPPSLHFSVPNPNIDFEGLRLRVVAETTPLPVPDSGDPVIVVNSFGFGGTNAQVLVASPPLPNPDGKPAVSRKESRSLALPLSARNRNALVELASRYEILCRESGDAAAVLCATAARGRDRLEHGLVALGRNGIELADSLARWRDDPSRSESVVSGNFVPSVGDGPVFVFTGQGSQWWAMARTLLDREPIFRDRLIEIDALLQPLSGVSILAEFSKPESFSRIDDTEIAQPALFAIQAGLVSLWESWGVRPSAVVGHSVGEVAASLAAGVLTLPEAVLLVHHRSRLQGRTKGRGRMAAVGLSEDEARSRIAPFAPEIEVAAINSPRLVTLAGGSTALGELFTVLVSEGCFARWIPIDYAFHTVHMDPIRAELTVRLADLHPRSGSLPFFSTVSGERQAGEGLDAEYWWRNVRETVAFAKAIEALILAGHRRFLEIGPHPALAGSIRDCLASRRISGLVAHSLKRESDDSIELASNFATLALGGVAVDWEAFLGAVPDRSLALPLYPWQKKPFWIESVQWKRKRMGVPPHPLLGMPTDGPERAWELILDPRAFPWLDDHRFWKRIVFPAAAYTEIGLAVGQLLYPSREFAVEDLVLERILFLSADSPPTLRIEHSEEEGRLRILSRALDSDSWIQHASARIVPGKRPPAPPLDPRALRQPLGGPTAHWDFYEGLREAGYEFGPAFRQIEHAWHGEGRSLAEIVVPAVVREQAEGHSYHSSILDACFQAVTAALGDPSKGQEGKSPGLLLPAALASIRLRTGRLPDRFWVSVTVSERSLDRVSADLDLLDPSGDPLGEIRGFRLERVGTDSASRSLDDCFYRLQWEPSPLGENPVANISPGAILVIPDRGGIGTAFVEALEPCDGIARLVLPSDISSAGLDGVAQILHLVCLDHPDEESLSPESLRDALESGVLSLLSLAQILQAQSWRGRVLVALHSHSDGSETGVARLASAPVLGFLRVAAGELGSVAWTALLLGPRNPKEELPFLLDEVLRGDGESEVAHFDGVRHVRRMQRVRPDDLPRRLHRSANGGGAIRPYRIEIEQAGRLDQVVLNETLRGDPGPEEVEVRVQAAGINFRDLMKALAMYPGENPGLSQLGDDCSGTVLRVGSAIDDLRPGDAVVAHTLGTFRSHLLVHRSQVFPKPSDFSFADAATVPTVFATAHYAIHHVGRLKRGESILIHAATGGVGLAAIQVAQDLGLEIFATAGTEEKRDFLRGLGIARIMDSRSLAFAEEILESTGGRGVDAVLNSLSGEFLRKSLSVLAPMGRFLEIGKIDLYADRRLGMASLRRGASFHVIDLELLIHERPQVALATMDELSQAFSEGRYRPLPFTEFTCDAVGDAFRFMAHGNHIGKIVLDFSSDDVPVGPIREAGHLFRPDRTFLVAGGTSGFGFETAKWLVANGVRHLGLISRSGPADDSVREGIVALEAGGTRVLDLRADLTDAEAVFEAVRRAEEEMPPVGGVVQAAMVLEDRYIPDHDRSSFESALLPKVLGAWHLHLATRHRPLDLFLCHSSFSAAIGASRQSNYAAANNFLDELARYRRSCGLAGLSVNWGALSGAGYAERNRKTLDFLEKSGAKSFTVDEALGLLGRLLRRDTSQIVAAKIDWPVVSRLSPIVGKLALYRNVAAKGESSLGPIRPLLLTVLPEQQRQIIEEFLATQVAAVFGTDESSLDRTVPVTQLGLDSLMAVELLNRIERDLGIAFPMGAILGGPSIRSLVDPVLEAFRAAPGGAAGERDLDPDAEQSEEA